MLARSVVAQYGSRARFVSENYGDSALAKRFGVTRYPAIFVEDVLVATPNDFGFYGKGEKESGGRYAPLKSAEAHEKFRADLARMIDLLLAGRKDDARAAAAPAKSSEVAALPAFSVTSLDGKKIAKEDLAGKVVLVEFWATWCPPCRGTLDWLGQLQKKYGDRLVVLAIAIESPEAQVSKVVKERNLPLVWVQGAPDLVRSFGDVSAVPTLLLFDKSGRSAGAYYGAPPELHGQAETKLASLIP